MNKKILAGLAAVALLVGVASCTPDSDSKQKPVAKSTFRPAAKKTAKPKAKPTPVEQAATQAQLFRDCVAKGGLKTEKAAVEHVTKVDAPDEMNNILDTADVFTDYKGDMFGADGDKGKLIASAFGDCFESKNGLVSVYNEDGELLANGNF